MHRSAVPLLVRAALASAAGLVTVVALASVARAMLDLSAAYPLKASAVFALLMAVAIRGLRRHHPFDRFGPANLVTTQRAVLVALVAGVVGESAGLGSSGPGGGLGDGVGNGVANGVALTVGLTALVATVLDAADGYYARRSTMASAFGARFDMEVDALLIMALAVLVVQFQKAGVWVLASGLMRYLFVAAAWVLPWMSRSLPLARRRQAVCVIQMSGLMLALAPFVPAPVSVWVAAVSLVVLAWSFWVDVRWLWHHAPDER